MMTCQHEIEDKTCREYRERNGQSTVCGCSAKYVVDNVPLCARHAGMAALLIGSNRVKSLGAR